MMLNFKSDEYQGNYNLTQSNNKLIKTKIKLLFDFITEFIVVITVSRTLLVAISFRPLLIIYYCNHRLVRPRRIFSHYCFLR